jgi:methylaspartate mutase sigma subunit
MATVLLSTVSSDAHTWNLVYLKLFLEEHGYLVTCLGACVPDELLIDTALRQRPDAIVVSSVNGHGAIDGARMVTSLRARPELADVPVVIGGKLGLAGDDTARTRDLLGAGFTAVLGESGAGELVATLADLLRHQDGRAAVLRSAA